MSSQTARALSPADDASVAELQRGHFRLFTGLDERDFQRMSPAFLHRSFAEEEDLLRIGEESHDIYFLLAGTVKVEIPLVSGHGRERIASMGPGNTVGEFALVRSGKVTAAVVAINEVKCLATNRDKLQQILLSEPEMGLQVYRNLSSILVDRLVDTNLLARNVLSQISLF